MTDNQVTLEPSGPLLWTGPHGLSLGGSYKGINEASLSGYWVHDHVSGRKRYKIYKIGVTETIGSAGTLEEAKAFCVKHLLDGSRKILAAMDRGGQS